MARKKLIYQSVFPYHVVSRCNNKDWFHIPLREVWGDCVYLLNKASKKYGARILEFVLMNNHYHLLIQTPESNLDLFMNYFQREISLRVGRKSGRRNHLFGGSYKACLLSNGVYFAHAYKYVLRNPVDAGLAATVEEYEFSTFYREGRNSMVRVSNSLGMPLGKFIPAELSERLEWLNTAYDSEQRELLSRQLRRVNFTFPKHHRHKATVESLARSQ